MGWDGGVFLRVLVELFDREPIENLLGACIFAPDLLIFLCDTRDATLFKEQNVYRLLRRRGLKTKVRFYFFNARDPVEIRRVVKAVVRDYPGCVFDYSGGSDLVLLTMGACAEKLDLPGYYIDLQFGRLINVNRCEHLAERFSIPQFTVEDVLALTGAAVHGYGHFPPQEIDGAFEQIIEDVWRIVHKNPRHWSEFVAVLQKSTAGSSLNQLDSYLPKSALVQHSKKDVNMVILNKLLKARALERLEVVGKEIHIRFAGGKIKRALLNAGIWLELYCYLAASRCGHFNDVRNGVVIDWDGFAAEKDTAKNEVDVLLVKGVLPMFVSCKMSLPSPLALSEVKLLSDKFGGENSRAALVCDAYLTKESHALQSRARELGIALLGREVLENGTLEQELVRLAGPLPDWRPDPLSLTPPLSHEPG